MALWRNAAIVDRLSLEVFIVVKQTQLALIREPAALVVVYRYELSNGGGTGCERSCCRM